MTNFKPIKILCLLLICYTCASAQSYKINGTVTGLADGTWLYLKTVSPDKVVDSIKIINGKFNFTQKATEKATQVALFTFKYTNYVSFWAEKNTIVNLESGAFRSAVIKGSATQVEAQKLRQLIDPFNKRRDSLNKLDRSDPAVKKEIQEKLRKNMIDINEVFMAYVKDNPNSLYAVNILSGSAPSWNKEKVIALYDNLSTAMKNTADGQTTKEFIALNKRIKIGDQYTDFEQPNIFGKKIKLSDIKGKYILLDFWASNCGPCREEHPNLIKTYTAFKDKGFNILSVSGDDNKDYWLKAVKEDQLPWENVSDLSSKNKALMIYGINAYPSNFLIDEKGKIIAKDIRGEALYKKLEELLP